LFVLFFNNYGNPFKVQYIFQNNRTMHAYHLTNGEIHYYKVIKSTIQLDRKQLKQKAQGFH